MENIISKYLTESCKASHTGHQCYLTEERKIQNDEEARKKAMKKVNWRKKKHGNWLLRGIFSKELENITKAKTISRDKLIDSQNKISMGLNRKAEFTFELEAINKKIKEMNWGICCDICIFIFSLDFSLPW